MPKRKLFITAYDVTQPSRLRKALHIVKDYATGGQKSAYECYLTPMEKHELMQRLLDILDISEDRFCCIELKRNNESRALGKAVKPVDLGYFYID